MGGISGASRKCDAGTLDELGQQKYKAMTGSGRLAQQESGLAHWQTFEARSERET